jgi:PAS domain S-box-containing protein
MNQHLERKIVKLVAEDYILSNLPGHLYWKDVNNIFLGCNLEQAKTFGLTEPTQVIGKTNFDFFDKATAQQLHDNDAQVMQSGAMIEKEEKIGDDQYFLSKKVPLKDAYGHIIGLVGTSMNITKQKALETRLARQAADLTEALELKERILRNVSHEIRTPLTGMSGISEGTLYMWSKLTDKEKKDNLVQAVKCQKALVELVVSMLDIAKLKSGTDELVIEKNDIVKLVRDIVDEFSRANSNILLEVEPGLDTVMHCDRIKILQVLRNLIGNAIKYSEKDSPIAVSIKQTKDRQFAHVLEISITDQGVGVPEDELRAIFEPFHESKRTRRREGGTGLGLSICKEIVDAHGGKIWAQSNKVGTTFIFTVPVNYTAQIAAVSQVTLKQLIENVPGHLYWKDLEGKVRACNREQAQDAGYDDIEGWIDKTNDDLKDPDDIKKMLNETDRRVIEEGVIIQIEEPAHYRGGSLPEYYLSQKTPLKDRDGKIIGLIGNSLDITERKAWEMELIQHNAELKKALKTCVASLSKLNQKIPATIQDALNRTVSESPPILVRESRITKPRSADSNK